MAEEQETFDLYAINLSTGERQVVVKDFFETLEDLLEIHIDNTQYYVFDRENHLRAFDRHTHQQVWKAESTEDFVMTT